MVDLKLISSKNGQVTVFIILGIILLATTVLFYYIQMGPIAEGETFFFQDTSSINIFIEGCLSSVGEDGIFYIGERGGYYDNNSLDSFIIFNFKEQYDLLIPFYFDSEETFIPSIEEIEEQLSLYIEDNLETCLSNFTSFTTQGWVVEGSDLSVESLIRDDNILLELNYPLQVIISEDIFEFEHFQNIVELDFISIYNVVEETLEAQKETPDFIIIGSLGDLARINSFSYEIDYIGDDVVWYTLLFDQDLKRGYPFEWGFAVQYNWEGVFEE